jgi:hypothetical protein
MISFDLPSPAEASGQTTDGAKGFAQAGKRYPPRIRFAAGFFRIMLQIETTPRGQAGVVSRQTGPANLRPHGVDRARRRAANVARQGRAAVAHAAHASTRVIDIRRRDSGEIRVGLQ